MGPGIYGVGDLYGSTFFSGGGVVWVFGVFLGLSLRSRHTRPSRTWRGAQKLQRSGGGCVSGLLVPGLPIWRV